ncbi:MAG: murein biosynthesis integral membrane protein MurJ [Patescibacteria group bacterium]|jgi:putative peptidoglycan lipid II flippase
MFKKIKKLISKINKESQSITSAAIIIGGLSVASRILGVIRDRVLASQFGAGDILDAYYAAFRLPDLVYNLLILGAVSAGLIPIFTSLLAKHQEKEAWKLINSILNLLSVALLIACGALFALAPLLLPLITPGFTLEKMELAIALSRIMFLSPIFLGLSSIFSSVLQSQRKFFLYSLAPIVYNLGIIFGALFLVKPFGVAGLAWGVVIGAFLHMIIQLLPLFGSDFKYRLDFNWRDRHVMEVFRMMVPRTISLGVSQFNFLIITVVASTLAAGSLSIFTFANNLQNFPLGIFGVSLGIAALPVLSTLAAQKKNQEFVTVVSTTFRQTLFLIVPIAIILYVLRAQIVRVLLGAGRFDWYDTRLTAASLAIFCIGLFAAGAYPLIIRSFYALHDTKTPFYAGLLSMIVNVTALLVFRFVFSFQNWFSFAAAALLRLSDLWGYVDMRVLALPAAMSVSAIFELLLLMILLRNKIGRLDIRRIANSAWRITIASIGGGLTAYFSLRLFDDYVATQTFWGIFSQGLIAGILGLLGYTALGLILKIEEMFIFLTSMKRKLFKSVVIMTDSGVNNGSST